MMNPTDEHAPMNQAAGASSRGRSRDLIPALVLSLCAGCMAGEIISYGGPDAAVDEPDAEPELGCGNGVIEPELGETCDPSTACPATCDDDDACTADTMTGVAESCNVDCRHEPITQTLDDDGCCPPLADATVDTDCWAYDEPSQGVGTEVGQEIDRICGERITGFTDS